MCQFFSFISNGKGKLYYFNWTQRKAIFNDKLHSPTGQSIGSADSHSEICAFYDLDCDMVNKYEYNPLTKWLMVDQINNKDDAVLSRNKVQRLNFKKIMEPLIIKKAINPLNMKKQKIGIKGALRLLRKWVIVRDSIEGIIMDHLWRSTLSSIYCCIADAIATSVMDLITDFFKAHIKVYDWEHVQDSAFNFVWAYKTSFLQIKCNYDLSPAIKLWEAGYVPSYDGTTWRLHGYNGQSLWEGDV